ncbi:hypothetical protein KIH75_00875 [Bifidobacterium sp. 64T4]|uniref:hypothetical protein n=1 Tax=Bifidobacterium pongonis TaxID=2834432 RepID=UPI001C581487|nr:hypothetical protein [Bifidobacterium pongonis]MBW3093787.1 hypothetical protein [Bifidobacterium pongonis]MBW3093924.1 hypothetical protein [Bifidobacterium pongonis]
MTMTSLNTSPSNMARMQTAPSRNRLPVPPPAAGMPAPANHPVVRPQTFAHTAYASRMPSEGPGRALAVPSYPNLAVFSSPSGGIGLSTLTALSALSLSEQGIGCALLDADIPNGGLGILLGIEHEPGLSLQDIDAPLGQIDGKALNRELPHWEDINVLACTSWRGSPPEWWELQAAIRALCEANRMVLADIGDGGAWENVPELLMARQIVAVEQTVLGLARAKAHLARLRHMQRERAGNGKPPNEPIIILVEPRGVPKRLAASTIATTEAIAYLGDDVLGPLRNAPRLCADILDGLGIAAVPKSNRAAIQALTGQLLDEREPENVPARARRNGKERHHGLP